MRNKYMKSNWNLFPLSLSLGIALGCCAALSPHAQSEDTRMSAPALRESASCMATSPCNAAIQATRWPRASMRR